MSPFSHCMEDDQGGAVGDEVIDGQVGSPERLLYYQHCMLSLHMAGIPNGDNVPSSSDSRLAYS